MQTGRHLFETPLGTCGIAWSDKGVVALQLPEEDVETTEARLAARVPDASSMEAPAWVRGVAARVAAVLAGAKDDLRDVALDMERVPPFSRKTYEAARAIDPGTVLTYRELAERIGSASHARAVGMAMSKNPFAPVVPCHRVLARGGALHGFSAHGGTDTKARMLSAEGVRLPGAKHPALVPLIGGKGFDAVEAVKQLARQDPALGRWMREYGPFTLAPDPERSPYASLARAVAYQQLTGKAAATIWARVEGLFPGRTLGEPAALLATDDAALRAAGLSNAKVAALKDIARRTLDGTIPDLATIERMTDEDIVTRLTKVRGVGRWTVEMLLLFRLGRPDVLPVDDYGVRKGFQQVFRKRRLPTAAELSAHGERWRPWRSVASWYLWRALDPPA